MRWTSTGGIAARVETVGQAAAREVPLLNPLPGNAFRAAAALPCRVDTKGEDLCPAVVLLGARPGSPATGCRVALGADWLNVRHDGVLSSPGTRSLHKGSENLVLDHYLEVLVPPTAGVRWPGPPPLVSARATGVFTDGHQRFWDTARRKAGDRDGTKALIGVLLLHRTLPTRGGARRDRRSGGRRPVRSRPGRRRGGARRHLDSGRPAAMGPGRARRAAGGR